MKFARIAISYIIKYLLGFLLIFVSSAILYAIAEDNIESYIIKQTQMRTEEGIRTIEDTIDKLDLISQMMYQSTGFNGLIYQGDTIPKENILRLQESNNFMKKINSVADYVPYMFTLFQNNNLYLSSSQCSTSFTDYYGKFLSLNPTEGTNGAIGNETTDAIAVKTFLFNATTNKGKFLRLESIRYTDSSKEQFLENALIYLTDGAIQPTKSPHIFCFVLSKDYLTQNILGSELAQNGFLYIRDRKTGDELVCYGRVPEIIQDTLPDAESIIDKTQEYLINITFQNKLDWQIITGIPTSYINQQVEPVQELLMTYLRLGFIAVIILTLYFSLSRYYGFQKVLVSFPKEELELINKSGFNDYKLLTEKVTQLDRTHKSYQQQLNELNRQNQAILLENLITNGIRTPHEQKIFESYFAQEPEFYNIILVRFLQTDLKILEAVTVDMVQFLTKKQLTLLGNVHSGVSDELFLIEQAPYQDANTSNLTAISEEMVSFISEQYEVVLHVGISAVGTGLANINKCYEQAKQIVQAQSLFENENAVKAYTLTDNALNDNPINMEFLNRLYTMLTCGQYSEIVNEMAQIEGRYRRMPYLYEAHKEQVFYSLRNVFYTAVLHLNCKEPQINIPEYNSALQCREMIDAFLQSAAWICKFIQQSKKSNNINLKDNIHRLLLEQYSDPGLSAFAVTQKVGISEKYFYQFWKEQTGETFSTTLLHIRINKAKEYLEQTDYSNEQIAVLTGFATANTFYRNFQKITGVTPKTYRDHYIAGKE